MANIKLFNTLNDVFNDDDKIDEFLFEMFVKRSNGFNEHAISFYYSQILLYYLTTMDEEKSYSFLRLFELYEKMLDDCRNDDVLEEKYRKNLITNGYFTHSFNGAEKQYVLKYGFNFYGCGDEDTLEAQKCLRILETEFGQSAFIDDIEKGSNLFYFCNPSIDSISYAFAAPERFTLGPLYVTSYDQMMVGMAKKDFAKQKLMQTPLQQHEDCLYDKIEEAINIVTSYYCTQKPCIGFLKICELRKQLGDFTNQLLSDFEDFSAIRYIESFYFSDLTLPIKKIKRPSAIIEIPDLYDLKQRYAHMCGFVDGDEVEYHRVKRK